MSVKARPLDDWHEDRGPVLWWVFPIEEPPYCGTPLDTDWPGWHTHWTPLQVPQYPADEDCDDMNNYPGKWDGGEV